MFLDTLDLCNIIEYLFANESDFCLLMEDHPHQVWGLLGNEQTVHFEKETQVMKALTKKLIAYPMRMTTHFNQCRVFDKVKRP